MLCSCSLVTSYRLHAAYLLLSCTACSCCVHADCNGQTSTATVTLKYVLPVAVTDDTYKYSASPLTVAAAAGLLANDVNPPNCAAQGKPLTAVRTTAAASGTVVVRSSIAAAASWQLHRVAAQSLRHDNGFLAVASSPWRGWSVI